MLKLGNLTKKQQKEMKILVEKFAQSKNTP